MMNIFYQLTKRALRWLERATTDTDEDRPNRRHVYAALADDETPVAFATDGYALHLLELEFPVTPGETLCQDEDSPTPPDVDNLIERLNRPLGEGESYVEVRLTPKILRRALQGMGESVTMRICANADGRTNMPLVLTGRVRGDKATAVLMPQNYIDRYQQNIWLPKRLQLAEEPEPTPEPGSPPPF